MKDEYIIINKSVIQKRIEELERLYKGCEKPSIQGTLYNQLGIELKKFLSQSTPLIPEIEKAFDSGELYGREDMQITIGRVSEKNSFSVDKQDYISNLNLIYE